MKNLKKYIRTIRIFSFWIYRIPWKSRESEFPPTWKSRESEFPPTKELNDPISAKLLLDIALNLVYILERCQYKFYIHKETKDAGKTIFYG